MSLQDVKLSYYQKRSQYVLMNDQGTVLDTCHTLFRVEEQHDPIFAHIPFLEGMHDLIVALHPGEEIPFNCIQADLLGRSGYYDFVFLRQDEGAILWLIYDFTEHYEALIPTQQERNSQAIESEHLRIKQRAIELERELLAYKNEELKRTQSIKTAFFSQVSHEMRTPISSIMGLVNLMSDTTASEHLTALQATAHHLSTIVNDVLDLSKLEAGRISLEQIAFDLRGTVQQVANSFLYACRKKGLHLHYQVEERLPTHFLGDPTRLAQVLYNLMSNAVKFTSTGRVALEVGGQKKKAPRGSCTLA